MPINFAAKLNLKEIIDLMKDTSFILYSFHVSVNSISVWANVKLWVFLEINYKIKRDLKEKCFNQLTIKLTNINFIFVSPSRKFNSIQL